MGLDVYLYARAEQEASNAHNTAWEAWYEQYRETPDDDAEKVAAHDAIPPYSGSSDVPSEKHPEHLFNRRYLRSSYNGSGYNRAVPDFLADPDRPAEYGSLNWIFDPVRVADEYDAEFTEASIPALEQAKARAIETAEALRKCDPLRVMDATAMLGAADHMWFDLPTDDQVLAWFREEKARNATATYRPDSWYSTAKGTVFGFDKGNEIFALTVGKDVLGRPCAMAVYRGDVTSYVESAEITAEFCDEAIMLVRRDGSAFMSWSG